ncbi:hypothetical protein TWF481_009924 [Arthrobotrys musiformis]|uniref:Uncharacterized protein n=1 Tax=Arthrobotrys musiformis TaxID=47236 RepID=A0AAV9W581_9PEZI
MSRLFNRLVISCCFSSRGGGSALCQWSFLKGKVGGCGLVDGSGGRELSFVQQDPRNGEFSNGGQKQEWRVNWRLEKQARYWRGQDEKASMGKEKCSGNVCGCGYMSGEEGVVCVD